MFRKHDWIDCKSLTDGDDKEIQNAVKELNRLRIAQYIPMQWIAESPCFKDVYTEVRLQYDRHYAGYTHPDMTEKDWAKVCSW